MPLFQNVNKISMRTANKVIRISNESIASGRQLRTGENQTHVTRRNCCPQ